MFVPEEQVTRPGCLVLEDCDGNSILMEARAKEVT